MVDLGAKAKLFPTYEIGVAQGCCLSPLIGNILLHDFDTQMNGRRVVCLRYIDDFIILADTKKRAEAAFRNGLKGLESLGLDAYDPKNEIAKPKKDRKANIGPTRDGIDFLGCEIVGNKIRPNKDSRDRLLAKIDKTINESKKLMKTPGICCANKTSFVDTLKSINNVLEGWGNQYFYCNETEPIKKLDRSIDERLNSYIGYYSNCVNSFYDGDFVNRRRILGVHLLIDSFNRNHPNSEPQ
jgi:hypothetical protein